MSLTIKSDWLGTLAHLAVVNPLARAMEEAILPTLFSRHLHFSRSLEVKTLSFFQM